MIDLHNRLPFASGSNRLCFEHPDDPGLCLKIVREDSVARRFNQQPAWKRLLGKRRLDDNHQERKGYHQLSLEKADTDLPWQHLPRFHGVAETSLGPANVTDLIREQHGRPAFTLHQHLATDGLTPTIRQSLDELGAWLIQTGLMTRNLLPHNLVMTTVKERPRLFLVDGLGGPGLTEYAARASQRYRQRYIGRRIERMWIRIQWELNGCPGRWEDIESRSRRGQDPF